jgi:hypothetical protein
MTATKITPGLITTLVGATGLPASAGYEFVSSVTASTSTTVAFTSMATGYDYRIQWDNLQGSANTTISAELGVTGPTYRTSAYLGQVTKIAATTPETTTATANIMLSRGSIGNATDEKCAGYIEIRDPANASTDTFWLAYGGFRNNVNVYEFMWSGGFNSTAEAHTAIQFKMATGTIATGFFKLYRRPNA